VAQSSGSRVPFRAAACKRRAFASVRCRLEQRLAEFGAELRTELRSEIQGLRLEMHAMKADLIKWMFLFWAGTALGGLLLK